MVCKDCIRHEYRISQLEAEKAKLKEQNEILMRIVREQDARIKQLELIVEKLQKENEELKARLKELLALQSSPRRFPKKEPEEREPKQRGRPPGFKGTSRYKPEEVDETIELQLSRCSNCGSHELISKGRRRRISEEMTKPKLKVKEYWIHIYKCMKCGQRVEAKPVDVLPNSRFGLRFGLFITLLKSLGMTYNKIRATIETVYDTNVTEKTLYDTVKKVAKYLGPVYDEFIEAVRNSKAVGVDDTGWNKDGENWWLWAFTIIDTAVYKIAKSRGHEVPESILSEDYDGVVTKDGHSSFNLLHCKKQSCWVHIKRNIKKILKKKPPPSEEFVELAGKIKRIFKKAKRVHEREQDKEKKLKVKEALEKRIERLWPKYSDKNSDEDCRRTMKFLIKHKHELFTFLEYEEAKWHNNDTERAIRPNVVIRKNTYGNRSEDGIRAHEIVMSVTQTCKLRRENFMLWGEDYFQHLLSQQAQKGK